MAESQGLSPLARPSNLREFALERLRSEIVTGRLAAGTLVSAPALGQSLGMSATPVREAMMDLTREGLVTALKNKGFRVTEATEKELNDLTEIRLMLELPVMSQLVGCISEEGFAHLRRVADACLQAAERVDLELFLREDREFHSLLISFGGNLQLAQLATSLRAKTRMPGLSRVAHPPELAETAHEHHRLIELLRADDSTAATSLLRDHIVRARTTWS